MSANPALVIARSPISDLLMPVLRRFVVSREHSERALDAHHRILEEIQARDPEAAALMVRKHVNEMRTGGERAGLNFDAEIGEFTDEAGQRDRGRRGRALSAGGAQAWTSPVAAKRDADVPRGVPGGGSGTIRVMWRSVRSASLNWRCGTPAGRTTSVKGSATWRSRPDLDRHGPVQHEVELVEAVDVRPGPARARLDDPM